jgi:energy-coupling factor transport system ATP-binding protein
MPELSLEGLVHVYREGRVRAIDGVDLRIGIGERAAIIGQNGSGKSTLVRHLNGLLRPTAGRVVVDGVDAAQKTVAQLARSVGLAFQDPDRQIFAGSARAEVEYGPRNLGLRGAELRSAVDAALAAVGLEGEARTNPYDLGSSRRKLLALASVLAMGTPVLVLDEPTTGQDERGVERVRAVIEEAHRAGRTVIVISHDMRFVAGAFERVVVMRAGRVILDGAPQRVFAPDAWEALESTFLEPPLPALIGGRLGLGSSPTDEALIRALAVDAAPGG